MAEVLRECSPPTMSHMSYVTCHMSHVMRHMSHVTCHVSCVPCIFSSDFLCWKSGGAGRLRVCYQQGLPRLVLRTSSPTPKGMSVTEKQ